MASHVLVRQGTAADLPAVFAFVEELAAYERAADEVTTSPAVYEADFAAGYFELFIAEDSNTQRPMGMMLFHRAYSTWKGRMLYLEDFVVAEHARRQGVGEALWAALVSRAKALGCTSVKWQVLDWNTPAKSFYEKAGAELEGGWENGRLWL